MKRFAVFWLSKERELHSDSTYYVLGELMGIFNTRKQAIARIKELKPKEHQLCTIIEIWSGEIKKG